MADRLESVWSSVLMRTMSRSGASSGMSAMSAGPWKAWAADRTTSSPRRSSSDSVPATDSNAITRENAPAIPSTAMMSHRLLKRSAATPPKGESSAVGSSAAMPTTDRASADSSAVVTCQITAKVAAQVASTENAWPVHITAIALFQ